MNSNTNKNKLIFMKNLMDHIGSFLIQFKSRMNLTMLVFTIGFFSVQANTYLPKTKTSLNLTNASIHNVLDNVVLDSEENLQNTLTGKVIGADGMPLPGASILEKGTQNGTQTDFDGNFTINLTSKNAIIVISYVGFTTKEIPVGNQKSVAVTLLQDTQALDEVVVVGFGVQKKSHLTAAVEQISSASIENRPINRLSEALQGAVAGLYVTPVNGGPSQESNFNIRGFTGFNQLGGPLVLVDGVERTMSDVNPSDVETVTILKDAAASAIYGSRAPSGVILITTKGGKKGDKMRVNYSSNFSIGSPIGMPSYVDSWDFAEKVNGQYRNSLQQPIYREEVIQRMRDFASGVIPDNNIVLPNGAYGAHWDQNANSDWFDIMYKSSIPSQQHNASISGGSEKTGYYVGLGYNESQGIVKGAEDRLNRYNSLVKVNTDAANWLNVRMSMNYVRTDELSPNYRGRGPDYNDIWTNASGSLPNWVDLNPNGSPHWLSSGPSMRGDGGEQTNERNEITLTGGFTLKPLKGLNITGNYTWRNLSAHLARNTFVIPVIEANGSIRNSGRSAQQSSVLRRMDQTNYHTSDLVINYNTQIKKHSITALLGYQEEYNNFARLTGTGRDLYTNSVPSISTTFNPNPSVTDDLSHWATQGVFGRLAYNFDEKYFIEFNGRKDAHSKFPSDIRWAFFPSISGAWNIAKENFWPIDQVSAFKLRAAYTTSGDPGSGNYLYLPTMGTGIGNGDVLLGGVKPNMVFQPALVSADLTWSKPETLGFGLDIMAFKNRLEMTYDWYQRTIYDQPGPARNLPETLGTGLPSVNNAVSETRGWEYTVKWRNTGQIADKPFNYSARFNISDFIGYVVEYDENIDGRRTGWTPGQVFGDRFMYRSNGIAQNLADLEANVPQGGGFYNPGDLMMQDLNGDGQINTGEGGRWFAMGDQINAGSNYGRYQYGINLAADWNGFDISVQLTGVPKWKTFSNNGFVWPANFDIWNSKWFDDTMALGHWTPETPDAYYPRASFKTYAANDQYEINLAHLRIQNLRIGYNLPKVVLDATKLAKVYVYLSGENLGMIYYKSKFNYQPELIARYGGAGYPPQRQISVGMNIGI